MLPEEGFDRFLEVAALKSRKEGRLFTVPQVIQWWFSRRLAEWLKEP